MAGGGRAHIAGETTEPPDELISADAFPDHYLRRSNVLEAGWLSKVGTVGKELNANNSWASSPGRRRNMQANRSRDTRPELAVRRLLHAQGFRYRVGTPPVVGLRRRADIVFTKQRIAVFIDGCFWHGCEEHGRKNFQHNVNYWQAKIATNMARDLDTTARLADSGWRVLRFWEHEPPATVASAIAAAIAEDGGNLNGDGA